MQTCYFKMREIRIFKVSSVLISLSSKSFLYSHFSDFMGKSVSPMRIKSVVDFPNPLKLVTIKDPREEHMKMLKELTKNKMRSQGMF